MTTDICSFAAMLLLLLMMPFSSAIGDSEGDAGPPDIIGFDAAVEGDYLSITIKFSEPIVGDISGDVFIDTDQDPNTGYLEGSGADYVYHYSQLGISSILGMYDQSFKTATLNDEDVDSSSFSIDGSFVRISLNSGMLGYDDGAMDIFTMAYGQIFASTDFDRAPDSGFINTMNGQVRNIWEQDRADGESGTNAVFIEDPVGDSKPDIIGLNAEVNQGVLNIVVSYKDIVEPDQQSYGEDLTGSILIDSDCSLATGFVNAGEVPPTFGIDYIIEYNIGALIGTYGSIKRVDKNPDPSSNIPGTIPTISESIGAPRNDATFKAIGSQVLVSVPLSLLGNDEGKMYLIVQSSTIQGLTELMMERVPDNGALYTEDGSLRPALGCTSQGITVDDPPDDSLGMGYDGDEIASVNACLAGDMLIFTVEYSRLELDDGAVTTIVLDTDPDDSPEYYISYFLYSGILGAQLFGGDPAMQGVTHLIGMSGDKMYLSVPLSYLGNDDGSLDFFVKTSLVSSTASVPDSERGASGAVEIDFGESSDYDRAPDEGYASLGAALQGEPTLREPILQPQRTESNKKVTIR